MYFIITDSIKNQRWAYGDIKGNNPSLADICKYLMSSTKSPEIFTIIFFTAEKIIEKVPLLDYVKRVSIDTFN